MKKLTVLLFVLTTFASAQLRVGLDLSRTGKASYSVPNDLKAMLALMGEEIPGTENYTAKGIGLNIGYELMLLSLVGVGAEMNLSLGEECGNDDDKCYEPDTQYFGYGVAKFPVFPMVRGVVKGGLVMSTEKDVDPGLGLGFGLRVKPPILPLGVEASYNIYNLSRKEDFDGMGSIDVDLRQGYFNLSATYSF